MRLSTIKLSGFKSFVDPTTLHLPTNMTGVVDWGSYQFQRPLVASFGIIDETGKPAPYVEYPSFENRCFVTADPEAVMLTDQATFCLSSGYRHCPRLAAAQGKAAPASRRTSASPTGDSAKAGHSTASSTDPLQRDIEEMEAELQAAYVTRAKSRRRWGWFGAATIFMSTLLCVGLFAAPGPARLLLRE